MSNDIIDYWSTKWDKSPEWVLEQEAEVNRLVTASFIQQELGFVLSLESNIYPNFNLIFKTMLNNILNNRMYVVSTKLDVCEIMDTTLTNLRTDNQSHLPIFRFCERHDLDPRTLILVRQPSIVNGIREKRLAHQAGLLLKMNQNIVSQHAEYN